jgi:hypothetical protein
VTLSISDRVKAFRRNLRGDLVDDHGANLDLYVLLVVSFIASIWGFFASPPIGILLACAVVMLSEMLRNRHSRNTIILAIESLGRNMDDLKRSMRELDQRVADPALVAFKQSLHDAGRESPKHPRVKQ